MTTQIRKAIEKKLTRLLKKHKKQQIFWSTAEGFFDMCIQTPKGKNILLPYTQYQFFQRKIFRLIDFPNYALDRTSAFKSVGADKIYLGKKKQIVGKYKFSNNCAKSLYVQEKSMNYDLPTISKIHKYRFPKQAICKPFLFGISVSSKIIAPNQMFITLHCDYEYINFKRECIESCL